MERRTPAALIHEAAVAEMPHYVRQP